MLGNSFGRLFRVTTCGESYGAALLTIVDGVPAGLKLTNEMVQVELDKRRPGQTKLDSPRLETDIVDIVSGILEGYTTGAPVGMLIHNVDRQDIHVKQYRDVKEFIRPGHAEYPFYVKYGEYSDWCGAGRASGRETVGRVAAGAVAKLLLDREGIEVLAHTIGSHGIKARALTFAEVKKNYKKNSLNCCDLDVADEMIEDILKIRKDGDTVGGEIEVIAHGVPAGLGEQVFDKLRATIAHGIMSVGAITGLEFGAGFDACSALGSEWNDQPILDDKGRVRFESNNAGGFLGGISNGEDLVIRCAVKPTPTISKAQKSIDMEKMEAGMLQAITRRDISLCPRMYPVLEAMVRLCIMDALMMTKGLEYFTRIDPKYKEMSKTAHERGEI